MSTFDIIIMAAGQGKRMFSARPKVLHAIAGVSMLEHVVNTARQLSPATIYVVIGHEGARIQKELAHLPVQWVWQTQTLGTGHAVLQALPSIPSARPVLILSGDVPLIQYETLQGLIHACSTHPQSPHVLGLLLANHPEPAGFGRILRCDRGNIQSIMEEKDASPEQKKIQEIYTGICYALSDDLKRWLPMLTNDNAQKEYYLTAILEKAVQEAMPVVPFCAKNWFEIQGVNNKEQLQTQERNLQARTARQLMESGVTLMDASRIDVRGTLTCENDVVIDLNTLFIGDVLVGENTYIGPHCVLTNTRIGKNCHIHPHSVLEDCVIGDDCSIGPFARLRTGTQLATGCKIGNFVETKKAHFAAQSKASHLSYLGDVTIGTEVNIGAGTITCNYDGVNKHQTVIEDGAFIGSDTQLVAPVTVGKNATIGAGTTLRKNAPADALTLTETKQKTVHGWHRPMERS